MRNIKIRVLLITCILIMVYSINSFAGSRRVISEVSIKVNHNIKPGDYPADINLSVNTVDSNDVNIYSLINRKYTIEDAQFVGNQNRAVKVGDVLKIKVKIMPNIESDTEYYFNGSYNSSNVKIDGGEYSSVSKADGGLIVYIKLKPIRGSYSEPQNLTWTGEKGKLRWDGGASPSNYYDIILKKGNTEVARIENYNGRLINLRGYMIPENTYRARVRAVKSPNNNNDIAQNSSWVESDEFYLDKNAGYDYGNTPNAVGPGVGNLSSGNYVQSGYSVGWILQNGVWYYRYPNGAYKVNGWEKINNLWYLFDNAGRMLTGWQNRNGFWYYLNPSGDMKTGWHKEGNSWYFLNTDVNNNEGVMLANTWLQSADGKRYYIGQDGRMCEGWCSIGNNWFFFYPGDGSMARNTVINTFYVNQDGVWVH